MILHPRDHRFGSIQLFSHIRLCGSHLFTSLTKYYSDFKIQISFLKVLGKLRALSFLLIVLSSYNYLVFALGSLYQKKEGLFPKYLPRTIGLRKPSGKFG